MLGAKSQFGNLSLRGVGCMGWLVKEALQGVKSGVNGHSYVHWRLYHFSSIEIKIPNIDCSQEGV